MKKTVILIISFTLVSKILGFGREILLAYYYGSSSVSDAYLISLTIPGTLFALVVAAISTTYIPMYTKIEKNEGKQNADRYTSNVINFSLVLSLFILIITYVFPAGVVKLFASGFSGQTLELAIEFTKITVIGIVFLSVSTVISKALNIKKNFLLPVLIGVPYNAILVSFIYLSARYDDSYLPFGIVISMFMEFIFLYSIYIYKYKYKHSISMGFKSQSMREMILLTLPVIFGTSVNQLNTLIDRNLASNIVIGGVSALNYSNRLIYFIFGLLIVTIATLLYPHISKLVANKRIKELTIVFRETIVLSTVVLVPITVFFMYYSVEIITILFGRGNFDKDSINLTSSTLFFYSIGFVGLSLREITSRFFYAFQDTKIPVINATVGLILNIIFNLIFSRIIGLQGLALATSISSLVTAFLLIRGLKKYLVEVNYVEIFCSIFKITTCGIGMGLILHSCYIYLMYVIGEEYIAIFVSSIISLMFYSILLIILKVKFKPTIKLF